MTTAEKQQSRTERLTNSLTLIGFVLYAAAAPHSIAASWVGISLVTIAWLLRTIIVRRTGLAGTPLDLPLWLFFGWTVVSCALSPEPRISIAKIVNVLPFLFFYLTQSLLTRKIALIVAGVLILSAATGVLWGVGDLIIGRGVIVKELRADSPLRAATPLREGDAIWRVNGHRVATVSQIDEVIRTTPARTPVKLSVISQGEHVEWPGLLITEEMRKAPAPSGITGGGRTHNFRASGFTRHYETFAEQLQIIVQFALGFALAIWSRRKTMGSNYSWRMILPAVAFVVLVVGIALTAMRTTLVAFALGALMLAWRALRARQRTIFLGLVIIVLVAGAFAVWRTRAGGALELSDPSSALRVQVARIAAARILLHPIFGHGMDAVHEHWNEWGFPGQDMLHAHSTPIQLAFDRGLPALFFWIWLMSAFWKLAAANERRRRSEDDASAHGLSLGTIGALAGFLASSLVNYNFGDSEVALMIWWMMGATVVLSRFTVPLTAGQR